MKVVHSRDNLFFKELRRLVESGRERKKAGLVVLDGLHLIRDYERAVGPVQTLVASRRGRENPEAAAYLAGRPVVELADPLLAELGIVETPSGVLALAPRPPGGGAPRNGVDTVVLDGIQDPGNVGTLLRTAAAAGFAQAVLGPGCADPWSPKVLRAGQGAHFALAVSEEADLPAFLGGFAGTAAATSLEGSASLYAAPLAPPVAWVFGSEGRGVSAEVLAAVPLRVRIPMPGAVESLNVAAAAAVCLFETVRRRLAASG